MTLKQNPTTSSAPAISHQQITRRRLLGTGSLLGASSLLGACAGNPTHALSAITQPTQSTVEIVPIPTQAPATEGYTALSDVGLWYWDTGGSGETIVLLHPYTGSGASWLYQQPVFAAAGYRVIGYSRRGFYKSETGPQTAAVAASIDLARLADALGLRQFHLVASAAGSIVAADFAQLYPQRIRTLVLASSIMGIKDEAINKTLSSLIPKGFHTLPPDFRELGPSYRAANPEGTRRWLEIEAQARPGSPGLSSTVSNTTITALNACKLPLLLLTGDADLYMPPAVLQQIAAQLTHAHSAIIDNAGHAAFWEQPATFNRLVLDFIAGRQRLK